MHEKYYRCLHCKRWFSSKDNLTGLAPCPHCGKRHGLREAS